MNKIDVTPIISQFEEHLRVNDRTIFSARFGDGKTCFLREFMESCCDKYEFIVLYPVNYQIAPNEAIMEYIKRDILLQLILRGYIKPDVQIPDQVLFQWYLSQHTGGLFMDVAKLFTSLAADSTEWAHAMQSLMAISQVLVEKTKSFSDFKSNIEHQETFQKAADTIESLSNTYGNIYELDMVSYLIIQTLQQIKNQGKRTILIIEDLDRIDPAHLFRILNVFSAHIDRNYQCSPLTILDQEGNEQYVDQLHNKFGFDNVVMVMDYDTTQHIYSHFYGKDANYQGYIGKFIAHNVFRYSITEYAQQVLIKHLSDKCNLAYSKLFTIAKGYKYIRPEDVSVRTVAQMLDSFDESIMNVEVPITPSVSFMASTSLTRTISTLRRLGMADKMILEFLKEELEPEEQLNMMGGFLMKQANAQQSYYVYYRMRLFSFEIERREGNIVTFGKCIENDRQDSKQFSFLKVNMEDAFYKACSYVN